MVAINAMVVHPPLLQLIHPMVDCALQAVSVRMVQPVRSHVQSIIGVQLDKLSQVAYVLLAIIVWKDPLHRLH